MSRIVVPAEARVDDHFLMTGEALHHAVHVLRLRVGAALCLVDGSGTEYDCVAEEVTARSLRARIVAARPLPAAPHVQVRLCCAVLKGDKLDLVLQKGTEIGVDAFVLYHSERTTVRIAPKDEAARLARWSRIVAGAVAQCGRAGVPTVRGPLDFASMLDVARDADCGLVLWESRDPLPRLRDLHRPGHARVSLVIGPEGGLSHNEIDAARAAGLHPVTLGPAILRAETAAIVGPALMLSLAGELG